MSTTQINCQNKPLLSTKEINVKLESICKTGAKLTGSKLTTFFVEDLSADLTGFYFLPFPWLVRHLEETSNSELGAHSRISGDIRGEIYLRFAGDTAAKFIQLGMKSWGIKRKFFVAKVQESIISEVTNIFINTFCSVLLDKTPIKWALTPPVSVPDISKSFKLASKIYYPDRNVLLTEVSVYKQDMKIEMIFLPFEDSLNRIICNLKC